MTNTFVFGDRSDDYDAPAGYVVTIPPLIRERKQLFETYCVLFQFPDYFGFNWDAFDECINDLSWISADSIVVFHTDIPLEHEPDALRTYLHILADACCPRPDLASRKFTVIFPLAARGLVESLMVSSQ